MLTMPTMPCGAPVQCFVRSSARRSVIDQTLKYGSCVTSGTAGGRSAAGAWAKDATAAASSRQAAVRGLNFEPRERLIQEDLFNPETRRHRRHGLPRAKAEAVS